MTNEDKALIEQIDKKIKQAEKLIFEAKEEFYLRYPNDKPIVEPKEVCYVKCLIDFKNIKKGKIYKAKERENGYDIYNEIGTLYNCSLAAFTPATEAEFNQQKGV
jgi:hypothetical protein